MLYETLTKERDIASTGIMGGIRKVNLKDYSESFFGRLH